jgi:hypothetical protein
MIILILLVLVLFIYMQQTLTSTFLLAIYRPGILVYCSFEKMMVKVDESVIGLIWGETDRYIKKSIIHSARDVTLFKACDWSVAQKRHSRSWWILCSTGRGLSYSPENKSDLLSPDARRLPSACCGDSTESWCLHRNPPFNFIMYDNNNSL